MIGLGPFDVLATVENQGLNDFTGASATVTITGTAGVDYTNTVTGIDILAGANLQVDFGDWTPSAGFETYDIDITVAAPGEQNACNDAIAGSSYILLGTVVSSADFEANDGGFTEVVSMGDPIWQWGTDAVTGAFSGTNVWGTILGADYPTGACASLRSPSFVVPANGGAVAFYAWYEVEDGWDYCNVKISTDGGTTFSLLTPISGYDSQESQDVGNVCDLLHGQWGFSSENPADQSWQLKAFNLAGFEGLNAVISIDFASDLSYVVRGFYLDDFMVISFPAAGCDYVPGDINGNGSANGIDVTYGVTYLKGGTPPPDTCFDCPTEGQFLLAAMDVNGSCSANGIDITYFVAYLKSIQPALLWCDQCAPITAAVPAVEAPAIKVKNVKATGGSQ